MRVAHLIITYTNPAQTARMINRMQHPNFDFYIHVDAKFPIESHAEVAKISNVYLIQNRVDVQWAAFSTIQAELNGLQEILNTGRSYDFISLMSGQDYPIKTVSQMQTFFEGKKGKLLLKYRAFSGEWEEGLSRVNRYHLTDFKFKGQYFLERLINKLIKRTDQPKGMKFYGSSMFWVISPEAAEYVLTTVDRDPTMKRFFKFTWAPDEFLFQTVLLNSSFATQVINENCHYYKHPPQTPSPKTFDISDFHDIIASDRLYARKFDMLKSPELFDKIDEFLSNQ
ncbi:beta-1,6-N-acetylglucosaminyltransferase [Sediminibacterium sp.]|uniref:beta-1,6-N-acetylglucosaminyltransferase n=1 Tax=Sediminibacterium sp. TaxID=1917865 RepID=UPI003F6EF128